MSLAYGSTVERIVFNAHPALHRTYHVSRGGHQSGTSNLYRRIKKTETTRGAQKCRIRVVTGTGMATVGTPWNVQRRIWGLPCRVLTYIIHRSATGLLPDKMSKTDIMGAGGKRREPDVCPRPWISGQHRNVRKEGNIPTTSINNKNLKYFFSISFYPEYTKAINRRNIKRLRCKFASRFSAPPPPPTGPKFLATPMMTRVLHSNKHAYAFIWIRMFGT
jgi:hypothetical protein